MRKPDKKNKKGMRTLKAGQRLEKQCDEECFEHVEMGMKSY